MKRRIVLAAPALALLAVVLPPLLLADRLPDPIATHFGGSGVPDGKTDPLVLTAAVALIVLVLWAFLIRQARVRGEPRLTIAPWIWAGTVFFAGMMLTTVEANLDAASWHDASLSGSALAATFAAAGLAALAAYALERGRVVALAAPAPTRPSAGLRPGEQAHWSTRVRSWWTAGGAAATCVALVGAGLANGLWWLTALGPLLGIVLASVSEIVATVDARGLTIAYGPLGWPRQTVPLDDIAGAESVDIDPWRYGGWGYRKVPRRAGATAIVIRAGEGIRVQRRDGRDLFVTVPDSTTAAGLLNDLVDQRG